MRQESLHGQIRELPPQHTGRAQQLHPVKSALVREIAKFCRTSIASTILVLDHDHATDAMQAVDQRDIA